VVERGAVGVGAVSDDESPVVKGRGLVHAQDDLVVGCLQVFVVDNRVRVTPLPPLNRLIEGLEMFVASPDFGAEGI
jgi:hypothetical protein